MFGWIGAIVFGLIAGIVAKLIMPGRDPGGCIITSILGIVGAVIGQALGSFIFHTGDMNRWSLPNFLLAVIGAIILLVIYRLVTKNRHTSPPPPEV